MTRTSEPSADDAPVRPDHESATPIALAEPKQFLGREIAIAAWLLALWPAWLGAKASFTVVRDIVAGFGVESTFLTGLAGAPFGLLGGALALLGVQFAARRVLSNPAPTLKNLVVFAVVVWLIATLTFFLAMAIPGGPFTRERQLPPQVRAELEKRFNLDQSLAWQYANYIKNLALLDFGPSYYQEGRTVNEIIARSFPISMRLGIWAVLISLCLGVPMGVVAALWQNRWQDYAALGVVVLGVSVPSFIFGTFEQYFFAYQLKWLPASGLSSWREYLMPSIALSTLPGAFIIRLIRSEMIDVMGAQYIVAARARGLSAWRVVWKHAIRNALLAVVTYMGPIIAGLFTGSFVIERIFDIPGLGREFVQAIGNRDYNLILGTTIFYSALLVGLNMAIDSLYKVIDPRVGGSEGANA